MGIAHRPKRTSAPVVSGRPAPYFMKEPYWPAWPISISTPATPRWQKIRSAHTTHSQKSVLRKPALLLLQPPTPTSQTTATPCRQSKSAHAGGHSLPPNQLTCADRLDRRIIKADKHGQVSSSTSHIIQFLNIDPRLIFHDVTVRVSLRSLSRCRSNTETCFPSAALPTNGRPSIYSSLPHQFTIQ